MKFEDKTFLISKNKEKIILLLFWILYIFFDYIGTGLINISQDKSFFYKINIFYITIYIVQFFSIVIIYFLVAPKILKKINWKTLAISLILSYSTFIFLRYTIEQILTDILFNQINYFEGTPLSFYIYDNLHFGTFTVLSTLFIWISVHLINTLKESNTIQQEKKDAEIKFLKAQINPHFLFNTLNNIYSLVSVNSNQSLKAIENLSAIMRFTTYETNKDKIEIQKELDYIQQYLALEKIRFGNNFFIQSNFDIYDNSIFIPPYIISPLIENAIKHGVIKDKNYPINISIKTSKDYLEINVTNKINQHQKDKENGIGLMNLKQRLNHYYDNNYQFEIKNDYETFSIYIKFPINDKN